MVVFRGTASDDNISGSGNNDDFLLWQGGSDTVDGGGGNDIFRMGSALNAGDKLDGGTGTDAIALDGDYAAGVVFNADTIANIEVMTLAGGHSYNLTLNDGNVAASQRLLVRAETLGAGDHLTFDGSAETDGKFYVIAGAGDDTLTGGARHDVFDLSRGGNDTVHGGGGNDTFLMGNTLTAADQIDGGAGNDTLVIAGNNFSSTLGAVTGIETLVMTGDFIGVTTNDGNVAAGAMLTVDMSGSDFAVFDGRAETDGSFHVIAGLQNETMRGGQGDDSFDMTGAAGGGSLGAFGNGGNDLFVFAGNFGDGAAVNGGAGNDTVELNGDYSGGDVFASWAMTGIETLKLDAGNSYNLTTNNGNVGAGQTLTVDASALGAGNALTFNGAAETDGFFAITGGAGDDTFKFGAHFNSDSVDGGAGNDTLELNGDYSSQLGVSPSMMANVETLKLDNGFSYNLVLGGNADTGATLTVDASALTASHALVVDATLNTGQAVNDGHVNLIGGSGDDTLIGVFGEAASTTFTGGLGADIVKGQGGNDIFVCKSAAELSGAGGYDTLIEPGTGHFSLAGAHTISNVSVTTGTINAATFDTDLNNASNFLLGPQSAAIVVVRDGDLTDHAFLVVDVNGDFAYEAGTDYVFDITNFGRTISPDSFI